MLSITRNEATLPFEEQEIKRGDNKGSKFLCPTKDYITANIDSAIQFLSKEYVARLISSRFKLITQSIQAEIIEKNGGLFNSEQFIAAIVDFSSRGDSIADLEERYDELVLKMRAIIDNFSPDKVEDMKKISAEIKQVEQSIADRRRGPRNKNDDNQ